MNPTNKSPRITFDTDQFQRPVHSFQSRTPKIVQWVMHHSGGVIKDEKQAQYVLLGFIAVAFVIMFIFLFSGGGSKAEFKAPPGQKIMYPENAPPRLEYI